MTFQEEVVALALQIAQRQRGEGHLQDVETLQRKFLVEQRELEEAEEKWDEIPDVVYYAACLKAQGRPLYWLSLLSTTLRQYSITPGQAQAACLAKYRRRAAGMPKDIEAERAAILAAIEAV